MGGWGDLGLKSTDSEESSNKPGLHCRWVLPFLRGAVSIVEVLGGGYTLLSAGIKSPPSLLCMLTVSFGFPLTKPGAHCACLQGRRGTGPIWSQEVPSVWMLLLSEHREAAWSSRH